jgi:Uma2 family endonuclease
MTTTTINPQIDRWTETTWEEYLKLVNSPDLDKAKCYYRTGKYIIEMSPLGNDHSKDHSIINYAIQLFATVKGIALNSHDCCSYRQSDKREAQPDLSFYIGEKADIIPWGTSIINLDEYPAPDLVIEIAKTSLVDDLGEKRLLYEDIGVKEYWIVDVDRVQIIAFLIENNGSRRIDRSLILADLEMSLLAEALQRTRTTNHATVGAWLMQQFSN